MSTHFDFSTLSATWHQTQGPMKMLHRMNEARMKFVKRMLSNSDCGLDIGAGAGIFSLAMAREGFQCQALEKEQALIEQGKRISEQEGLDLVWHHADIFSFTTDFLYDYLCCFEVIEHVDNRVEFIARLLSFIKPGGYVFLSTINRTVLSYLTTILGAEYLLKLLPVGTHDYRLYIKPEELTELFSEAHLIDLQGLIYNPLTGKFFLGQYSGVNYIAVWQKPQ